MTEEIVLTKDAYDRIRLKFPNRVPVFVFRHPNATGIDELPKKKFLVPFDLSVGQFIWVIRKHLMLPPEKAMFVFVGNTLPASSQSIRELYATYKSPDGALRLTYTSESVFGIDI
jgi:GABA(A) receptor-associated protein